MCVFARPLFQIIQSFGEQCRVIPLERDTFGAVLSMRVKVCVMPAEQRRALCLYGARVVWRKIAVSALLRGGAVG
jgi:hypothetical protein